MDAAIISLMITMMCHLSCRQALTVRTARLCQAVLCGSVGTHTRIKDNWGNGSYL